MTCLILTSRLSGLKSTHYWVRDDEKVGYLGLKKKFPPAAGTLIGNLLERRAGLPDGRLCRGLIVIAEHTHDMLYTHITSI